MSEPVPDPLRAAPPRSRDGARLRIGMICPYSLSIPGGVQQQAMGLARELRRMGYEVRVLGPCDGPPPATFVSPLGNSLPTAANGSIAPIAPDPIAQFRTIRILRDEEFDVVHLHEPLAPGATETALFLHPAPLVGTFHAAGQSNGYRMLDAPLRRLANNLDHRVAVSPDALALARDAIGGEYEVLFNAVELERYRNAPAHRLDGRTILFCGRHEDRKGLGVLLTAFPDLPDDVTLLIGSDGPATARLRASVGDHPRIRWLGRLNDDDKVAYMKGSSLFCAPSLHGESFGVVLIEAMAAGTVVVASALDGYRNVATHEVDALLCEPGDVGELVGALRRVLDEPGLAERLRAGGARRAEDFSMAVLAGRYLEIYHRLLADRSGSGNDLAMPGRRRPTAVSRLVGRRNRMMRAAHQRVRSRKETGTR